MRTTKRAARRTKKMSAPQARRMKPPRRQARRRNPGEIEAAAQLSEEFHGRPAKRVREYDEPHTEQTVLADLGALKEIEIETPRGEWFRVVFGRGARLAASPDGRQLYLVGGDQAAALADLGLTDDEADHEHVLLGAARSITYSTRKGFHNFELVDYVHEFGEDGGTPPTLNYDATNKRLYFVGGTYKIRPEGIVN